MKNILSSRTSIIIPAILLWIAFLIMITSCSGGSAGRLHGWDLDETTTGIGSTGISLPLYIPPDDEIESGTWYVPAGSKITGKRIKTGGVVLDAGGITFRQCLFRPTSIGRGMPLLHGSGPETNLIMDCEIDGSLIDPTVHTGLGTSIAISAGNIRVEGCNIHHFGSGVAFHGSDPVVLRACYIHHLVDTEYNPGDWSHTDGFTIRGFSGPEAVIQNNRIDAHNAHCTGAVFLQATWDDSFYDNIRFEGNLLEGNGYNLMIERSNGAYGVNIRAVNNRFNVQGYGVGYVDHGPGWAEWRRNFRNNPHRKGNRGAPAPEPMTQGAAGLAAPGNLTASAAPGGTITLSWSDNSADELGFKIMRSIDGAFFDSLTIVDADSVSYADTVLAAGTTYYYRIAAVNDEGISDFSNSVNAEAQ